MMIDGDAHDNLVEMREKCEHKLGLIPVMKFGAQPSAIQFCN